MGGREPDNMREDGGFVEDGLAEGWGTELGIGWRVSIWFTRVIGKGNLEI